MYVLITVSTVRGPKALHPFAPDLGPGPRNSVIDFAPPNLHPTDHDPGKLCENLVDAPPRTTTKHFAETKKSCTIPLA
jgi:hypothetical protein